MCELGDSLLYCCTAVTENELSKNRTKIMCHTIKKTLYMTDECEYRIPNVNCCGTRNKNDQEGGNKRAGGQVENLERYRITGVAELVRN
mmetsp:Transcript_17689/g.17866  ORF Transcript_17689/g.17866 Transcript_17689/m.17866 type:complete len:89 (-) Transcript_17689:212-478(-)